MLLKTHCELAFEITTPTPFVFMLRPRSGAGQWIQQERYDVSPRIQVTETSDVFGNLCQRMVAPVGSFSVTTSSLVETAAGSDVDYAAGFVPVENIPDEILMYLLPSRYCESDRQHGLAVDVVGDANPGYAQVAEIVQWIRQNIEYLPGSSGYPVSSLEVVEREYGVCRDLAQVGIGLCRSLCIPARLVVGYLHELKPMDIHAWFEAFVGGRWYTFDPTQSHLESARIAIAYGRDAADVAICNQYGPAVDPTHMLVRVDAVEE
jgi:transglutaminase-like putative cysteine protease